METLEVVEDEKQAILIFCEKKQDLSPSVKELRKKNKVIMTTYLYYAIRELKSDPPVILSSHPHSTFLFLKAFKEHSERTKRKLGRFIPTNLICAYSNDHEYQNLLEAGVKECIDRRIITNKDLLLTILNKSLFHISERRKLDHESRKFEQILGNDAKKGGNKSVVNAFQASLSKISKIIHEAEKKGIELQSLVEREELDKQKIGQK